MKTTELLKNPAFSEKLESVLSGHIMSVYIKANLTPPVPRWHCDRFVYADSAPEKYARHLREGMKLLAEELDKFNEKGAENE